MRRGNFTLRTKLVCATAAVVSLAGLPLVYLGYSDAYRNGVASAEAEFSHITRMIGGSAALSYLDTQVLVLDKTAIEKDDIRTELDAIEKWLAKDALLCMRSTLDFLQEAWDTHTAVVNDWGEFVYLSPAVKKAWLENTQDYLGVPFRTYIRNTSQNSYRDEFTFMRLTDETGFLHPYILATRKLDGYIAVVMQQLDMAGDIGTLGRTALSAGGEMLGMTAASFVAGNRIDSQTRLALKTGINCALELTASSLGKSVERMVFMDSRWKGEVNVADISLAPDQTEARKVVEGAVNGKVQIADLIQANLREILPPQAADAYMAALKAENGKLAHDVSTDAFLRNQKLRKAKYFEGLASDIKNAMETPASLTELRDARLARFHQRQSGQFAECLSEMTPGSSVAVDKEGQFRILGTSLEWGKSITSESAPAAGTAEAKATLKAEIGADLSDAVVFTKNNDGSVTVSVAKRAGAHVSGSAGISAGVSGSVEAGDVTAEASASMEATAGVNAGASYTMTVERTVSTTDGGVFIDKLISRRVQAHDLNDAAIANTINVNAGFEVNVSASAAIGFSVDSESASSPDSENTVTDEDGNIVETSTTVNEDGSVTASVETTNSQTGLKHTETTTHSKSGSILSSETATELSENTTVTETFAKEAEGFISGKGADWPEVLEAHVSAEAGANGSVSATRTTKSLPTKDITELAFKGTLTLHASASAESEALNIAGDLTGNEWSAEVSTDAVFGVENTYARVDDKLSSKTLEATKRTTCTFSPDSTEGAKRAQLMRLMQAQKCSSVQAEAIMNIAMADGLDVTSASFEGEFKHPEKLESGLRFNDFTNPANYENKKLLLRFEQSTNDTPFLTRLLNQAGRFSPMGFEFRTTATQGQEIEIDLDAVGPQTLQSVRDLLEERPEIGLRGWKHSASVRRESAASADSPALATLPNIGRKNHPCGTLQL